MTKYELENYKNITDHVVRISSNQICETDEGSIPTGKLLDVVNTKYDLELIKKIYSNIKKRPILLSDVIKLFKANPELIKINTHVKANNN